MDRRRRPSSRSHASAAGQRRHSRRLPRRWMRWPERSPRTWFARGSVGQKRGGLSSLPKAAWKGLNERMLASGVERVGVSCRTASTRQGVGSKHMMDFGPAERRRSTRILLRERPQPAIGAGCGEDITYFAVGPQQAFAESQHAFASAQQEAALSQQASPVPQQALQRDSNPAPPSSKRRLPRSSPIPAAQQSAAQQSLGVAQQDSLAAQQFVASAFTSAAPEPANTAPKDKTTAVRMFFNMKCLQ